MLMRPGSDVQGGGGRRREAWLAAGCEVRDSATDGRQMGGEAGCASHGGRSGVEGGVRLRRGTK